ncbi:MAG: hypothetical protein GWN07_11855, partial [Actinobacteria bacterium]|nr:hypothetical protein [Actinomycetota bacterium]NIX20478.1 hypothetical protein [Actinomycetota bacterium]
MHDQAPNVASPVSPVAIEVEARVHRTLARRLEQLRDTAWTARVLGDALSRMAGQPIPVGDVRIDYCKIKPNRDIQVAALASVRAPG